MQTPTPSRRTKRRCSVGALASTLVNSSICYETDKKARRIRVQRLPTAYLLPNVAQTEIRHLRLKGSFGQNTLVAEEVNIIDEQFGHIVACPGRCFARVRQMHGYSP